MLQVLRDKKNNDKVDQVFIVGAGPAGLTAAYQLQKHGITSSIAEKDNIVGGIARTVESDGYRFDIGGHRFFSKSPEVNHMWHEVLGDDFLERPRSSRIYFRKRYFNYPLGLGDVFWNLGIFRSFLAFGSYLKALLFPQAPVKSMEDWVVNHFGQYLYKTFFKTYTEKVWGIPCSEIGSDWAAQRIKGICFRKAVVAALSPKKQNKIKSMISSFHYPRLGPGQMWEAVAKKVQESGGEIHFLTKVCAIFHEGGLVKSVELHGESGKRVVPISHLVSSMPVSSLVQTLSPKPPQKVLEAAKGLRYRDFLLVALIIDTPHLFSDNWIYIHDPDVQVGRIQNFGNWSKDLLADPNTTSLGFEYFCNKDDSLWKMSDLEIVERALEDSQQLQLFDSRQVLGSKVIRMPMAYPVYDHSYQEHLAVIQEYLSSFDNLHPVGRNGLHRYNNQDHSMFTAMLAVQNILGEEHDVWSVNADCDYHEEIDIEKRLPPAVSGHVPVPPKLLKAKNVANG